MNLPPHSLRKGRGAASNGKSKRFAGPTSETDSDWVDLRPVLEEPPVHLPTEITIEAPRTIITRNSSPDIPFDRSVNAYRGCEHGCVYCFARPTHAYLGLSPGQDFESKLFAKPTAAQLLRRELAAKGYECQPIALGTNTDPYQPIEGRYRITRSVLEVLRNHGHPVTITTKSARVTRDLDILSDMAAKGLALVVLSVTTLNGQLARTLEPRASAPRRRLQAIEALANAGVPTHVAISPCIPGLTDHEIEAILSSASGAGASGAFSLLIRLPHEVASLFDEWLAVHHPLKRDRVMSLIRDAREGRENDPRFHQRFKPSGAYAAALRARFVNACRRLGLNREAPVLRTDLFSPPGPRQLRLI